MSLNLVVVIMFMFAFHVANVAKIISPSTVESCIIGEPPFGLQTWELANGLAFASVILLSPLQCLTYVKQAVTFALLLNK